MRRKKHTTTCITVSNSSSCSCPPSVGLFPSPEVSRRFNIFLFGLVIFKLMIEICYEVDKERGGGGKSVAEERVVETKEREGGGDGG